MIGAFVFDCATAVFACVVVHFVSAVLLQRPSVIQGVTDSLLVHTSTKGGRFGATSTQNHNSVAANMMFFFPALPPAEYHPTVAGGVEHVARDICRERKYTSSSGPYFFATTIHISLQQNLVRPYAFNAVF